MLLTKRIVAVGALVLAVSALSASSAFASGEPVWNHTTGYWKGTLTFKRNGAHPTTCTFSSGKTPLAMSGGGFAYRNSVESWKVPCAEGATMRWAPAGWSEYAEGGGFLLEFENVPPPIEAGWQPSPWPSISWLGEEPTNVWVPFVNASGSTPSQVVFQETWIGITWTGEKITATGKLSYLYSETVSATLK